MLYTEEKIKEHQREKMLQGLGDNPGMAEKLKVQFNMERDRAQA